MWVDIVCVGVVVSPCKPEEGVRVAVSLLYSEYVVVCYELE